jgi:hypothetical protein
MTRSRGANRNARNSNKSKPILLKNMSLTGLVEISHVSHFTRTGIALIAVGGETTLHPNYAFRNGSIDGSRNLQLIGLTQSIGNFARMIVRKVKLTFFMENLDAVGKNVNVLPIPFSTQSFLGDDYQTDLSGHPNCRTILLAPKGSAGDTKTFTVIIDCEKVEGIDINNSFYTATSVIRGTQFTSFYWQAISLGNVGLHTNGIAVNLTSKYYVKLCQTNTYLNI